MALAISSWRLCNLKLQGSNHTFPSGTDRIRPTPIPTGSSGRYRRTLRLKKDDIVHNTFILGLLRFVIKGSNPCFRTSSSFVRDGITQSRTKKRGRGELLKMLNEQISFCSLDVAHQHIEDRTRSIRVCPWRTAKAVPLHSACQSAGKGSNWQDCVCVSGLRRCCWN